MKFGIVGTVAALTVALAVPVAAQERTTEQQLTSVAALVVEKLNLLGEVLEFEQPLLPADGLSAALAAAMPSLPTDDERLWDTTFHIDFTSDVSTGALDADEGGRTVLTDARGCLRENEVGEVVYFVRFTRGPVRGHRCITTHPIDDVWALQSKTYAEGPDRRLNAYYGVAMNVEGEPAEARRQLEARLDQNVALAGVLGDYALEIFLARRAFATDNDRLFAERLERMTEGLAEIAASMESPVAE